MVSAFLIRVIIRSGSFDSCENGAADRNSLAAPCGKGAMCQASVVTHRAGAASSADGAAGGGD